VSNFYDDNEDLRWYLETGLDWEPIVRITEYDWKAEDGFTNTAEAVDFYKDVLKLVGGFAGTEIAPRWAELDAAHPHLENGEVIEAPVTREILESLNELGLHGLCLPRELGGMNAPLLLFHMNSELFARADVSTCTHIGFHGGMAMAALTYSVMEGTTTVQTDPPRIVETRFAQAIEEMAAGQEWGSMDITEPGAGSDMAALRTRGEQDAAGDWFVTGEKIFITSGHGKYHFVIARTEETDASDAMAGLAGLSMFLVPAFETAPDGSRRWLATFSGVEEKLGHNASATVSIVYDKSPAHLIGKRGEGFRYMLLLMNNARVGVGFEAIGAMESAYRAAKDYAAQRPSMGKTIDRHEMIADLLDEMHTDIQVTRALCMEAAWHEEIGQKLRLYAEMMNLPETEAADALKRMKVHQRKSRALTPLLKWFAGEKAVEISRRAVQIHGGCGYIKEYRVEKILRDAMVFPIYEGTSQIQALMAMKDNLMGVVKNPRRFLANSAQSRWRAMGAVDPLERKVAGLRNTANQAIRYLLTRLVGSKLRELPSTSPADWSGLLKDWDLKRDFALALLHAERLCSLLTDAAVGEILWEQQLKDPVRRDLLERFLERAETRSKYLLNVITTTGPRLLSALSEPAPERLVAK
jgi:alkylation response protein AidB-like acyl-CoA dehydrogenase